MRLTIVAPSFVMMTSPLADTIYGQRNEACVNTSFPWHATRLPHHFVHALGTQTGSHGVSNGPGGRDVALSDRPTASLLLFALIGDARGHVQHNEVSLALRAQRVVA
jgi:hypothetical protein